MSRPARESVGRLHNAIGAIAGCLVGGWLGGQFNRRIVYFTLCPGLPVVCGLVFRGTESYGTSFLVLTFLAGPTTASFHGWFASYLPELFPTRIRPPHRVSPLTRAASSLRSAASTWASSCKVSTAPAPARRRHHHLDLSPGSGRHPVRAGDEGQTAAGGSARGSLGLKAVLQPHRGRPSQRHLVTAIFRAQIEKMRLLEHTPVDPRHNAEIDRTTLQKRLESGLQAVRNRLRFLRTD